MSSDTSAVPASGRGRLLLVRHGESEGNRARRFSPDPHVELTELGVAQARETGRRLAGFARPVRIVASSFLRARRTAELIAQEVGFAEPIQVEPDLRERSIGALAGASYATVRSHPSFVAERFWEWRPENGESLVDVQARAAPVIERLMRGFPREDVVVVSHGGVMLGLCAYVEGSWMRGHVAQNCEVVVVEHDGGSAPRIVRDELGAPGLVDAGAQAAPIGAGSPGDETDATG